MSKAHASDFRVSRPFGNLGSPFAKKTRPTMETSFRPQRAQCILTRPLDLSETRLTGEVVGSLPVDECSPMLGRGLVLLCVLNTQ